MAKFVELWHGSVVLERHDLNSCRITCDIASWNCICMWLFWIITSQDLNSGQISHISEMFLVVIGQRHLNLGSTFHTTAVYQECFILMMNDVCLDLKQTVSSCRTSLCFPLKRTHSRLKRKEKTFHFPITPRSFNLPRFLRREKEREREIEGERERER